MQKQFKREQRYFVVKVKDAKEYLDAHQLEKLAEIADTISEGREKDGIPAVECVVVESDWPEYESTWRAIEDRVTGAQPAPSVPECPYPCGWRNLLKLAIEDGAYLARSINEDEPVTENARAVTMRTVMRLRDVLMAINNAAPEAKP